MADQGRAEVINLALLHCGEDSILDPAGDSKNAKLCATVYDNTLAEVLSGHPWSFATTAAQLQQLGETPSDVRFQYAYQLPENCGLILSVECTGIARRNWIGETARSNTLPPAEYMVQGRKLLSTQTNMQIVYVRNAVLPSEMSPQFKSLFAANLALKVFSKITGSTSGKTELAKEIIALELKAKHADSEQTNTMPENRPNQFVSARQY